MGIYNEIYLDYAAATPLDERVFAVMEPYFSEHFYNPSSPYEPARQVARDIEGARSNIARLIGAKSDEIIFTAGATESINLLFKSVLAVGGTSLVAATEHHAVLEAAKASDYTEIKVDAKGKIDLEIFRKTLTDDVVLVSVALGNNEIGTLQPIKQIAECIAVERHRRQAEGSQKPLIFHTDASQGAGLVDIHVARLGIDAMTLNAAKIYGPKQVGLLWVASHVHLAPLIVGGGQERGLRSGTENVAGIIGFAKALELAEEKRKTESKRLQQLKKVFVRRVQDIVSDMVVSGDIKHGLPHVVHVSFPGIDAERVLFRLESEGIYVATGAACAANKQQVSHVLKAIGLPEGAIEGSLRFSFGRDTDETKLMHVVERLQEIIKEEKKLS